MFSPTQLKQHKKAALILTKIKDETFNFIKENKKNIREKEVQNFILKKFKENNLVNEVDKPIVAFGSNTGKVHYYPGKRSFRLKDNTLILLDIWARLNVKDAPYSDITWMAFHGDNIPNNVKSTHKAVIKARDISLGLIKKGIMPSGKHLDTIARKYLNKKYKNKFLHSLGHSIGLISPHGKYPHLKQSHDFPLLKNLPYTIEPGIYFKNKFGIRSEINFYINNKNKVIITTPMQKDIVII